MKKVWSCLDEALEHMIVMFFIFAVTWFACDIWRYILGDSPVMFGVLFATVLAVGVYHFHKEWEHYSKWEKRQEEQIERSKHEHGDGPQTT